MGVALAVWNGRSQIPLAYVEVSGISFPTERRIFARQQDASVSRDPLVVSIELSNIELR